MLQRDIRRWLCPPDPSINYNAASDVHHKGTARWFIEGNAFVDWNASGPLLWVYGKRTSSSSLRSECFLKEQWFLAGSGKSVLLYVSHQFIK